MAEEPRVQYASTTDGVSIAFADTGGAGMPLVFMRGTPFSHVQQEWRTDSYRFWYDTLYAPRRLITLDFRGCGLSDHNAVELSLDAFTRDLQAVVDKLRLDRFAISVTQADSLVALSYAAHHPDRVTHLMLWEGYASGPAFAQIPQTRAFLSMMENDWSLFVSTLAHFMNEWDSPAAREFAGFIEHATTQEHSLRFFRDYVLNTDVSEVLPQLTQPTIVFSHRPMTIPDLDTARNLAARIPNAELVILEGTWGRRGDDPQVATAAIDRLLGDADMDAPGPAATAKPAAAPASGAAEPAARPAGGMVTILFTDIEGSTAMTQAQGDAAAQDIVRTHNAIVREALTEHGGTETKHTGDGIMASFPLSSAAIEAAAAIQRGVAAHGERDPGTAFRVRIGVNAGEPVIDEQDLFGSAVQLARRVCDAAPAGSIYVTDVVRQLVAGKGFLFADQGETALRGFEDPVRMYEVRWRE
jgi:class 3 adenylate cyclase